MTVVATSPKSLCSRSSPVTPNACASMASHLFEIEVRFVRLRSRVMGAVVAFVTRRTFLVVYFLLCMRCEMMGIWASRRMRI